MNKKSQKLQRLNYISSSRISVGDNFKRTKSRERDISKSRKRDRHNFYVKIQTPPRSPERNEVRR